MTPRPVHGGLRGDDVLARIRRLEQHVAGRPDAETDRLRELADGARVFVRTLRESLDPAEHAAIVARLRAASGFPCPVLLLIARRDALVPPEFGPRFARDIPGSALRWVGDSSHFVQVEQPARTAAEILSFDEQPPA